MPLGVSGAWYKLGGVEAGGHAALHVHAQKIQDLLLFVVRSGLEHNFRIVEGDQSTVSRQRLVKASLEP